MDDLNLEDATLFFEMMGDISKKWNVSEKKLISIVEKIDAGDVKKLAKNHLGIDHKRLLQKNIFGPNVGKLRNNNFEKEFVLVKVLRIFLDLERLVCDYLELAILDDTIGILSLSSVGKFLESYS